MKNELGERIKKLRTERDMSMQELADKVGVAKSSVHRWESGTTPISQISSDHIEALAKALNTSVAYIRGEVVEAAPDLVLRDGGDGVIFIESKSGQRPQVNGPQLKKSQIAPDTRSLRMRSYAMDVLAADSGYAINYTPDGDVILTKGNFRRKITQADIDGVSADVSHFAALAFARLLGGQS